VDQIAIVKDRRGFGDAGLVAVRFGAFDHQRLGRNAQCERGALRRLLDGVGEAFEKLPSPTGARADRASSCARRRATCARVATAPGRARVRAVRPGTRREL
jgi:hypothetical protein